MPKKPGPTQPPAAEPPRGRSKLLAVAGIVAVVLVAAIYLGVRGSGEPTEADTAASAPQAAPAVDEVPAAAKFGPHTQADYPPLPETGYPPPLPIDTVREVYKFAADHPEVLGYIPCYCGCDRQGHKGNDDCFVAQRSPNGDVEQWDPHGIT